MIISASDTNWYEMEGGYIAGAHSVNPKITIKLRQIGPAGYDDSAGGKRVATSVIATGADVIFAMGDDASFGYLQAISTAKPPARRSGTSATSATITPIDTAHVLLSSVLWNFTNVDEAFIRDDQARHLRDARLQPDAGATAASRCSTASTSRRACGAQITTAQKGIESGHDQGPGRDDRRGRPSAAEEAA